MSNSKNGEINPNIFRSLNASAASHNAQDTRPSTLKDVARLAGVSQATVSRVVNGAENVATATRYKVLDIVSKLRYCPNAHAVELGRANGGMSRKRGV